MITTRTTYNVHTMIDFNADKLKRAVVQRP